MTRAAGPIVAFALIALLAGCRAPPQTSGPVPAPRADLLSANEPPWSGPRLDPDEIPAVYLTEWGSARNRAACALLAPASIGTPRPATPRRATFSGGWAVAYDLPELRSAFGIAGTGARAAAPAYAGFPYHREWLDGSSVDYGLEGGSGPNLLAYLRVRGQDCLYNVWSRLGREHLEFLISQLRYVEADGRGPG